ncbi:hypothetical protein LT330_006665 [Penicillium expansum]|nr:hypothetical protein LT330_001292 [Penicillium expansum]KAK4869056.1 hypothetical protein LT330_006665 [Penicillium expansum]
MLPTESLGWNGLQALKSRLSDRLARFTRNRMPDSRPHKLQNDAAFFEADLRHIFTKTPMVFNVSEHDYYDMDQMAQNLLASLNDMVNRDLIESLEGPNSQKSKSPESGQFKRSRTAPHDIMVLGDKYPRLTALFEFLDVSPDQFNLTTGPGSLLFSLPQGEAGNIAMGRVTKWKAFLEQCAVGTQKSQGLQLISLQQEELSAKEPSQDQPDLRQKRASAVVDTIFKEFRHHNCGKVHEIKLRVSDDWQTGPYQTALEMFVSSCPDGNVWQEAKCGSFHVTIDVAEKDSICAAIQRARGRGRKLYAFVDERGLFDISDKMPPTLSSLDKFTAESLGELLDQQAFRRITPRDYLEGATKEKFGSREKATLALALARCLMDFFDEDLELASYSWKPESIFFIRSSGAHASNRVPYISLRPKPSGYQAPDLLKTVGPGNPVLLSFARLLLEIDNGEHIPMDIHPESKANISKWGEMCAFVNVAEREGSGNYLKAVEGCLYLHMALPKSHDQTTASASEVLRKVIYDQVVRNLELMVNPHSSKRKRRDSVSRLPLAKKLKISSPPDMDSYEVLPGRAINLSAKRAGRPASRDEFEIAIVCALPLEYNAVSLLIDEFWDEDCDYYGRANGDPNTYTTGRIGKFDIVLVLLPNMGKVSAAGTSASLRSSYPGVRLILVTGICGGVPYPEGDEELLLGDVVLSKCVVQYDLGRQYPDEFVMRDMVEDSLGRAPKNVRNLLAIFETNLGRDRLEQKTAIHLQKIQNSPSRRRRGAKYQYPGAAQDKLFQSNYRHKHHISPQCLCAKSHEKHVPVCKESKHLFCDELGCDNKYLVRRERLESKLQLEREGRDQEAQAPSIFVGRIGSGDTVVKSGEDRDRIAKRHGLIAFEMEGAGVWDEVPCIVVKAVCDYADSHKNKVWQHFAAATAASATKALLERYIQTDKTSRS